MKKALITSIVVLALVTPMLFFTGCISGGRSGTGGGNSLAVELVGTPTMRVENSFGMTNVYVEGTVKNSGNNITMMSITFNILDGNGVIIGSAIFNHVSGVPAGQSIQFQAWGLIQTGTPSSFGSPQFVVNRF